MPFIIFNAFMVVLLVLAAWQGWKHWADRSNSVSAFIAILAASLFSFYVIVLGLSTAFSSLLEGLKLFVGAVLALFAH